MKHFSSLSLAIVVSLISLAVASAAVDSGIFIAAAACVFVLLIAAADYSTKSSRTLRYADYRCESPTTVSSQQLRLAA